MKRLILYMISLCLYSIAVSCTVAAREADSVLTILDQTLKNIHLYENEKKQHIASLMEQMAKSKGDFHQQYQLGHKLYTAYQKYQVDSAIHYARENILLATQMGDTDKIDESRLYLAASLSTSGKFIESKSLIDQLSVSTISHKLRALYFQTNSNFYSRYGLSSQTIPSFKASEAYRDSALTYSDAASLKYKLSFGFHGCVAGRSARPVAGADSIGKNSVVTDDFATALLGDDGG